MTGQCDKHGRGMFHGAAQAEPGCQRNAARGVWGRIAQIHRHQAETAAELDALLPSILDKAFKGAL